jgi:hypothetical protein
MLTIETARIFGPLLKPSRYKGAWGGRGSGKSHYMAGAVVEHCLLNPGSRIVCIREVQKTLAQSAKLLIENKIQEFGVGSQFRVLYDRIETPGGGLIIFQGMVDATAESIKSLEGYNIAWMEEAQTLSARSLALLRPTIRAENSEIWFSWNPRRKSDAVDQFLRGAKPDNAIVGLARGGSAPDKIRNLLANMDRLLDFKQFLFREQFGKELNHSVIQNCLILIKALYITIIRVPTHPFWFGWQIPFVRVKIRNQA